MVNNNQMPKASPFDARVAAEFRGLRTLLETDLGRRITQQQVAARLGRSQAYVSEQWIGKRPLGLDVIQATAAEARVEPESLLLALAVVMDPTPHDVSGMSDAEILDTLTTRQVSRGAYELAARRRASRGDSGNGVDGVIDGGS